MPEMQRFIYECEVPGSELQEVTSQGQETKGSGAPVPRSGTLEWITRVEPPKLPGFHSGATTPLAGATTVSRKKYLVFSQPGAYCTN